MMYELIQSALTATIQAIAIAGFGGCLAHAIWTSHTNWLATYCPPVAPYQEPEPQPEPQPQDLPEPEDEDIWEDAVQPATFARRLEVRHFSPVLALPPAKEAMENLPQPEEIELTSLDVPTLRRLCDRHQIAWKHARGKNRHMNKSVMVFQLRRRLSAARLA
jgi:hypothetical protein